MRAAARDVEGTGVARTPKPRGGTAIFLEQLLNGLDVTFESLSAPDACRGCSPGPRGAATPSAGGTRGASGVIELAGGATVRFSPHCVMIVPSGSRDQGPLEPGVARPLTTRARAERAWGRPPGDGGDPDVVVAGGRVRATYQGSVGLFDHLREPLIVRLTADDPLGGAFQNMLEEIAAQRPGHRAMAEALLRRSLILLLRRLCGHEERRPPWLAPLEDSRLGRAVAAMQERPEYSFTLPRLAEVAGMSRSVFAARFTGALGQSPIGFLKALRLARATRLLLGTDLPVKSVATRVGYSSRSSFTRAFAAYHGVGPMAFRAAAREPARPIAPLNDERLEL
jgi:AraC family transcriptional regulator, activator of mtrCDE